MAKFNFLDHSRKPTEIKEAVVIRIRDSKPDPYSGLRGHAYIAARGLNPPVKRVQTSALPGD